ncbi:MAG: hypothetical protein IKO05_12085 [Selenomonadaceae bacterium]|nr:hypothetical protein [Selenomonadaceae bacterium]
MRQIKFRGRDIETGEYVYAELGQVSAEINPEYLTFITDDLYTVDTESVAQLIGIDANGREVYEGDTVIRIAGDEDFNPEKTFPMAAAFDDYAAIRDEEIILVEAVTNEAN